MGGQRRAVSIPAISADWPAMVGHHANMGDSRLDFHVHSALRVLRDDPGNSTHKPRSELARSAAGEPHPEPVKGASPF